MLSYILPFKNGALIVERRCSINGTVCASYVYDQSVFLTSASADFNIVCDQSYLKVESF